MLKIYIAGPISKGDMMDNIRTAIHWGDQLLEAGIAPFVPHVSCFWNIITRHTYEEWCRWDDEWLLVCDAVFRIEGESKGADAEVALATKYGIPVFTDIGALLQWKREQR